MSDLSEIGNPGVLADQFVYERLHGSLQSTRDVPAYTSDIRAAWEVYGLMSEKGWLINLNERDDYWICSFRNEAQEVRGHGPNAAFAICDAACQVLEPLKD